MSNENQGEQFRQRRRELGLTRVAVAERAGYATNTIEGFERGTQRTLAETREALWRALQLLEAYDLPQRMRAWRKQHGVSIRAAADFAGMGENSWGEIEHNKRSYRPQPAMARKIEALIGGQSNG